MSRRRHTQSCTARRTVITLAPCAICNEPVLEGIPYHCEHGAHLIVVHAGRCQELLEALAIFNRP